MSPEIVGLVVPSTSPRVTGFLPHLNQHISFLVDSGSSVSILPWSDAVSKLGELRPYRGRVMSVSGGALDVVGERSVLLKFGSFSVEHNFLFCRNISVNIPAILGVDFLKLNGVVLDFSNKVLNSRIGSISFDSDIFSTVVSNDKLGLASVLEEFADVMCSNGEIVGKTKLVEHDIILNDEHPVYVRPRPIPFHLRKVVADQLTKMLELGIIKESSSPWSSPVLMVPKSNGQYRFCVDFRKLNEKTRKDRTPMPRINDVFAEIGAAVVFSTVDVLSGFWQVPMAKHAQEYTAFSVGNRHFEFTKMPFGLTGAPGTFARLMQKVLGGLRNAVVYGDDILIYSSSEEQHVEHVRSVLQRMRDAGLVLNTEKCQFGQKEVHFLGHRISAGNIMPQSEKVSCVQNFPRPESKKRLQSFIGMAGFYRRFIRNFSSIMAPLYDLLKGSTPWRWGREEDFAFQTIKNKLCDEPVVLTLPDVSRPFEVATDASDVGLGALLSQDGRVVEYASRKLNAAEKNYSTTDRELLAVVWALEKWRQYLFSQAVVVYTDHRPITFLRSLKEPKGRMARWISRLQEFSFELRYRPGADNHVADCLSRLPDHLGTAEVVDHETLPPAVELVSALLFFDDPKALCEAQRRDPELKPIVEALEQGKELDSWDSVSSRFRQIGHQLSLSDEGVLLRSLRHRGILTKVLVIPASERLQVLQECHGTAHMGVERTHDLVRANCYWPGLRTDVQKFVASCPRCQLCKPVTNRNKAPLQPIVTTQPMEVWAVDIMGPLPSTPSGARYIMVATDLFSKYVEAVPLVNQTAASVAQAIVQHVILRHGPPKTLLTDQGTNFESFLMMEVCKLLGMNKVRTSPFHPRTDGQTERANRTIKEWLAAAGGNWEKQLPFVVFGINCSANAATKLAPFQLLFGRHPPLLQQRFGGQAYDGSSSEFSVNLRKNVNIFNRIAKHNALQNKRMYMERYNSENCRKGWKPFSIGERVRYKNHYPDRSNRKFSPRYCGPFIIAARRGVNYQISGDGLKTRWVHHDEIFPWRDREESPRAGSDQEQPASVSEEQGGTFSDWDSDSDSSAESTESNVPLRRSARNRRPPAWMSDFDCSG